MTKDDIQKLFEHMWWADDRAADELAASAEVPAKAVELYAHILGAELVWLDRIMGAAQSEAVWPALDFNGARALANTARSRYQALLDTLSSENLSSLVYYTNSAGQAFDTRLDDILLHVALHGCYHRGQVALLLRDAGTKPSPTDYIGFVRGTPAATRKESG